jgi:hypothetical protein
MTLNPLQAEDPTVAVALVIIGVLTAAGLAVGPSYLDQADKDVWDLVIKAAGASVILIGSYFAARTLKQSRADQRDARILTAIGLVGDEQPQVRIGGLLALAELAKTTGGRYRDDYLAAIRETVQTVADTEVPEGARDEPKAVAERVLAKLPTR